jgi:hypothetical protein
LSGSVTNVWPYGTAALKGTHKVVRHRATLSSTSDQPVSRPSVCELYVVALLMVGVIVLGSSSRCIVEGDQLFKLKAE